VPPAAHPGDSRDSRDSRNSRDSGDSNGIRISTLAGGLDRTLEYVILTLMTGLAVLVVVGVVFRKAGSALVWYDELATIMLAWLTFYGAALAARRRAHIGFPRLVEGAPPRLRRLLVVFREVSVIGFFVIVAGAGWRVQQVLAGTYLVSMPAIPTGLAHSVIPLGALIFIAAELGTVRERLAGASPVGRAATGPGDPPVRELPEREPERFPERPPERPPEENP
jgi:TRAP-type C4-dicarboxylate transport system permease small subunit